LAGSIHVIEGMPTPMTSQLGVHGPVTPLLSVQLALGALLSMNCTAEPQLYVGV
jgi:hypothetical protein